jgi:serine/threonine protein kinase
MTSSYIGKVIDNYRIIQQLGIGGMGIVFKAVHTNLDKVVAIKMIAPGLAMNEHFITRFGREAKALAKMEDPNIVRIFDLRHEGDQWFIVMEFIEGDTLTDKIKKEGALPWQKSIPIITQILTSIGHAHQAGIIHRDIKPNNVMINKEGTIKITDFGLAKDQQSGANTMTLSSGGTLFYMSPEHVKGFAYTDHRSDIYSIGMTAYEMLTGQVPFDHNATDFDIREKIMRKDFPPMRKLMQDIPRDLDKIIIKSIAKKPEKRYQSAEEMLTDINAFYPPHPVDSVRQPHKNRKKRINFPITVVFLVLLAVIVFLLYIVSRDKKNQESAHIASLQDSTPVTSGPNIVPKVDSGSGAGMTEGAEIETDVGDREPPHNEEITAVQNSKPNLAVKPTENNDPVITMVPVSIQTEPPGATILSEGRMIGMTPLSINQMKTGRREFIFKKESYQDLNQIINVQKGSDNVFNIQLLPLAATATIISRPGGASIYLDGVELQGKETPVRIDDIALGSHTLRVKKNGFADRQTNIEIKKDEKNIFQLELEPLFSKLEVFVKPWGSIYIDDELKKENTKIKYQIELPVNNYTIRIVHPTLGKYEKDISLTMDQTYDLKVDFNKKYEINVVTLDKNGVEVASKLSMDGVDAEGQTPMRISMRTGLHTIKMTANGSIVTKTVLIDDSSPGTMKFVVE